MVQGKVKKISKNNNQNYYAKKRKIRHERKNHHFSKPKPQVLPQKQGEINDPNTLSKIKNIQFMKKVQKKIKSHQKKIYKSIEETIIEKAKKHQDNLEIL
jgi:hypothetical protein